MICHCNACNYTFNAELFHSKYEVPRRCPDCGKMKCVSGQQAVRAATDFEIAEYWRIQKEIMDEIGSQLVMDNDDTVERYDGQNNFDTLRRCV